MFDIFKIAVRNLSRYRRRTILTFILIVIGMVAVLLFMSVTGSFKSMMVGQITDSVLGHLEVHRKGYVASIDNLPLNLNLKPQAMAKIEETLKQTNAVQTWSPRVKFGGMYSNFVETTAIRINGVDPQREAATVPLLPGRISEGRKDGALVAKGEILIPALLARGMKSKVGDTVVLVATNRDGSVNGKTFVVRGVVESISGPGGRDGYIHIDDARELLRMKEAEVSEVAIRLKDSSQLDRTEARLKQALEGEANKEGKPMPEGASNKEGKPMLEVHSWADLSPFANLARMIDLMTVFIKVVLVSIVLVSVMNVMVMAVYERIREIGTIAAIGTPPGRILSLFLSEGLLLGLIGTAIGTLISLALIFALNIWKVHFTFGQQQELVLAPQIGAVQVLTIAVMVVGVAVLASLQPAWKASRLDPINALRHV